MERGFSYTYTHIRSQIMTKFLVSGGHGTFSNLVNNMVHVIMYCYYMISAMGPQYQKYLWWKKHLTSLQLVIYYIFGDFCFVLKSHSLQIFGSILSKLIFNSYQFSSIFFIFLLNHLQVFLKFLKKFPLLPFMSYL